MNSAEPSNPSGGHKQVDPHDPQSYFEFLAGASASLAFTLDEIATAKTLAGLFLNGLADFCVLDIMAAGRPAVRIAGGTLDRFSRIPSHQHPIVVTAALDPADIERRLQDLPAGESTVVTGEPDELMRLLAFSTEHPAELSGQRIERVVAVPLDVAGKRIGVVWLAACNQYALCTLADLRLACDLAMRGAQALNNAQLYTAAVEREQARQRELDNLHDSMQKVEIRLQRLFAANVIGILFGTLDGAITEANDAFLSMLGYSRADLYDGTIHRATIMPPEYEEQTRRAAQELMSLAVCTPFEREYIRKDGSRVPVLVGGALIEGSTSNVVSFVLDLTEQRRATIALRESEEENRTLLQAMPDTIFRLNAKGILVGAMAASTGNLPLLDQDFIGRHITEMLPPEIAGPMAGRLADMAREGDAQPIEYMLTVDGRERCYEARFSHRTGGEALAIVRDVTEGKEAERDLIASERRFRAVLENNWDAIWLLDSDGTILYTSPSTTQILGYSPEEMTGRNCFEMIHPADISAVREMFQKLIATPWERVTAQYRKMHRDGMWHWIEGSCTNLLSDPGVHALLGNFRDITERRRADQELASRIRQQAAVSSFGLRALTGVELNELMDDAVRVIATVLDVRFCKVLELLPDGKNLLITHGVGWMPGVVGMAKVEVIPDSQAGYTLLASDPVVVFELATETRFTGTPVLHTHGVVSGLSVIIYGKEDHPLGILGAHSHEARRFSPDDIHFLQAMANIIGEAWVRKDADEALHASEKHYRALIENSFDATALVAPDGTINYASPSTSRVLGHDSEEVVGMIIFDLLHPENREPMENLFASVLANPGASITTHYRSLHRNGTWLWIEGTWTHFFTEDGRPVVIANYHDVTERKEWEGELKDAKEAAEGANAAKDQFLAVLSHELRTPLTPVLASVEALGLDADFPQILQPYLEIIHRNVELEARLIDDLLDLTRIAKGKLQLSREVVDLHGLVHHVDEICRGDIRQKNLDVAFELGAATHHVNGDPARLQQVLWNLMQNAVKFTPGGGTITLQTSNPAPGRIRVEVKDSGIGIDPQIMSRIFNAFEQGERTITRRFGGLGLGLAISRMLVNAHGGTLEAASEGRDRGATFTIELDCADPDGSAERDGAHADAVPAGSVTHILLVDDHHDTSMVMKILLERRGYRISTADTVASALRLAASEHFDLVVSDIGLPDGSGLDLMRELHRQGLTRGIALSGFGMEADVKRSQEAGFHEHLTKPVSFQRLILAIENVLS